MDAEISGSASSRARSAAPVVTRSRPPIWVLQAVGRRTRVVRLALAVALVGGTLLALALVPPPTTGDSSRPPTSGSSCSTSRPASSPRPTPHSRAAGGAVVHVSPFRRRPVLGRRLRGAPAGDARARASEVRPLLPGRLPVRRGRQRPLAVTVGGLVLGRHVDLLRASACRADARAAPYTDRGVVLISDLADDPSDLQKLADTIALYSRRSIPLNVVALDPAPETVSSSSSCSTTPARSQRPAAHGASRPRQSGDQSRFPWATAAVAAFS